MDVVTIGVFVGVGAVGLAFAWFLRSMAAKVGGANRAVADAAFSGVKGFASTNSLIYLGSAIAYDASRKRVAIWEQKSGARLVDPAEVGAWHSGTLLTVILNRTTATPMVQLFRSPDDVQPFFKVGVLNAKDCEVWRERLSAAFGADKDRETDARILGVGA
jgi:hypothetical protein